jgi:hypothetical protein
VVERIIIRLRPVRFGYKEQWRLASIEFVPVGGENPHVHVVRADDPPASRS